MKKGNCGTAILKSTLSDLYDKKFCFYCPKAKLVIELDGSQHYEEKEMEYDKERTAFLNSKGIMVLRFTNSSIHNEFRNVCEYIEQTVNKRMENISYKAE